MKLRKPKKIVIGRRSHPSRGAWIEMPVVSMALPPSGSHPSRGAWIEINATKKNANDAMVAPREGCVD